MAKNEPEFESGWLMRVCHEAVVSIRANNSRQKATTMWGDKSPFPLSWADGEDIAKVMSERFKSWTGRSLEEHFAIRDNHAAEQTD